MYNLLFIIGLIKSLTPYIKKYYLNSLSFHEFLLINNLFRIIFVAFISFYYYYYENVSFENIKNIDNKNLLFIAIISFFAILSSFIFSKLDVTNIGSLAILLKLFTNIVVLIFGFLMFNEKLTYNQIIGISFCLVGIYLTNKK